jgi:hypothetical protein
MPYIRTDGFAHYFRSILSRNCLFYVDNIIYGKGASIMLHGGTLGAQRGQAEWADGGVLSDRTHGVAAAARAARAVDGVAEALVEASIGLSAVVDAVTAAPAAADEAPADGTTATRATTPPHEARAATREANDVVAAEVKATKEDGEAVVVAAVEAVAVATVVPVVVAALGASLAAVRHRHAVSPLDDGLHQCNVTNAVTIDGMNGGMTGARTDVKIDAMASVMTNAVIAVMPVTNVSLRRRENAKTN